MCEDLEEILAFLRFQNRRAKEKRLKKDSGRRWPNVLRNGAADRKNTRMKTRKNQNNYQEEDTSNEGDTAVSYDGELFVGNARRDLTLHSLQSYLNTSPTILSRIFTITITTTITTIILYFPMWSVDLLIHHRMNWFPLIPRMLNQADFSADLLGRRRIRLHLL